MATFTFTNAAEAKNAVGPYVEGRKPRRARATALLDENRPRSRLMQIVYATRRHPECKGRRFINPRFFRGVEPGTTKVFVERGLDRIAESYRAAGVPVVIIGPKPRTAVPEPPCWLLKRIELT